MSDEIEKKRQQKVANFKINFDENEVFDLPQNEDITSSSQSSESEGAVFGDNSELENVTDISSGEESLKEYPSDRRSVRKRHRLANKRRRKKAKSNKIVFRVVWITMVILVSILFGEYLMIGINDLLAIGREEEKSVSVTISESDNIDKITDMLYDKGIIKNKLFFKLYAVVTKSTSGFTRGTFEMNDFEVPEDKKIEVNLTDDDGNEIVERTLDLPPQTRLNGEVEVLEDEDGVLFLDFRGKIVFPNGVTVYLDDNYDDVVDLRDFAVRHCTKIRLTNSDNVTFDVFYDGGYDRIYLSQARLA